MLRTLLSLALLLPSPALAKARPVSPEYEGNCQAPRWSPDGSRLAYEVNFHDRKAIDLYVLVPGQGQPSPVKPAARGSSALTAGFSKAGAGGVSVVHELSWAPASIGRFVYAASGPDRDYDLYIDQGAAPVVVSPGADGGPEWSPDGRWIAFTSARTGQGDIYLLDTRAIEAPPKRLSTAPTSAELYLSWSPDGRRLAYTGHSSDGDNIFAIDDIANPRPVELTHWGHTQTRPSFSPDGRMIAFYSNHTDPARFDLWVLPNGGTPQLLATDVVMNGRGPTWTPDSRHIVFVSNDESRYDPVWAVPVAAPERARMVNTETVGNGDLDVGRGTDQRLYLAVVAQGISGEKERDFRHVFVMELNNLP